MWYIYSERYINNYFVKQMFDKSVDILNLLLYNDNVEIGGI